MDYNRQALWSFFMLLNRVFSYFIYLEECCNSVLLWSSRNVLWTTRLHLTLHHHGGRRWITFLYNVPHFLVVIKYKVRWRNERQYYFVFTYLEQVVSPRDGLISPVLVHRSQSYRTLLGKKALHLDFLLQSWTAVSLKDWTVATVEYSKEHFKHFCFYLPESSLGDCFLSVENMAKNDRVRYGGYVTWSGNLLASNLSVEEEERVN